MASTRMCPVCGRRGYAKTSAFCLIDGTRLREEESLARIGMRLRDYALHAVLGEGGMGAVYLAVHVLLEKPVAVKVLRQAFSLRKEVVEQFLVEAQAASRIRHPNIVDVTDFGITDDGLVFLVMEYLEGENLQMRLRRVGRLGIFEAVGIVNQIARALSAAHEEKVVHRDLKPENVFLEKRQGRRRVVERQPSGAAQMFGVKDEGSYDFVKIVDFGVAKFLDSRPGRNTRAGLLWGTPCYVSPEQARGQKVDGRSDIYSLGAMFYEMVTGQVPFEAETMLDLLGKHLHEEVVPPYERAPDASIDKGTNDTIVRCLAKNPDDRFQTMDEVCDALLGCFTDRIFLRDADRMPGAVESGISVPPKPTFRPRKLTAEKAYAMVRSRKSVLHRLRWHAAAMLVTLGVIGAGWYVYAHAPLHAAGSTAVTVFPADTRPRVEPLSAGPAVALSARTAPRIPQSKKAKQGQAMASPFSTPPSPSSKPVAAPRKTSPARGSDLEKTVNPFE